MNSFQNILIADIFVVLRDSEDKCWHKGKEHLFAGKESSGVEE